MNLLTPILMTTFVVAFANAGVAAEVVYEIDPAHTYPSFEADHMGISTWRGKFNHNTGTVRLDREAGTGSVEIVVDLASIDFGHEDMNTSARGDKLFDSEQHPRALYRGELTEFRAGAPTRVAGTLELRGIRRPLDLEIRHFRCIAHPLHGRELCGADAVARLRRDDFGIDAGVDHGFDMEVLLRIQVEAVAVE